MANLRQEINILTGPITGSAAANSNEIIYLDTTKYPGTATYYFEALVSGAASNTGTVNLRRKGTSTDDATISVGTSTSLSLVRTSFTPPAGQTEYVLRSAADGTRSQTIKSARVIVLMNTGTSSVSAMQTQVEIGTYATARNNTALSATSPKYWKYTSANYDSGTNFYAEVTWKKSNGTTLTTPSVYAVGTVDNGASAITPGIPAGTVADDILILFVETSNQAVTTPSGWNVATGSPQQDATDATRLSVFWRRATSSSETAPTVADSGDHQVARILGIRNCVTSGDPFDQAHGGSDAASNTSLSMIGFTTATNQCLVVGGAAVTRDANSTDNFTGYSNANLSSITEYIDNGINTGTGGGVMAFTGIKTTAGATGNTTVTLAVAGRKAWWLGALKAGPGNPSVTMRLQESDGSGDGFTGWTDKVTIVSAQTTADTVTRTRSAAFTPTNGRNYRLVSLISDSLGNYDTYNAKIIIDQASGSSNPNTLSTDSAVGIAVDSTYVYTAQGNDSGSGVPVMTRMSRTTGFMDNRGLSGLTELPSDICVDATYAYQIYPGTASATKIGRLQLSTWTTLTILTLEATFSSGRFLAQDDDYLYACAASTDSILARISKSDFSTVSYLTLTGVASVSGITVDSTHIYLGTETSPAKLVKVLKSDFATYSSLTLASGNNFAQRISNDSNYVYMGLSTSPGKVARVLKSDFSTTNVITLASGENQVLGVDNDTDYVYASTGTFPAKVVRINKSDWSTTMTVTFASGVNQGTAVVASGQKAYVLAAQTSAVGKIVDVDYSYVTKFETQYLLANAPLAAGTSLQNFLTKWDTGEWSGVTNAYTHAVDASDGNTSVVELDTSGGTQLTGSVVTSPDNRGVSTSVTMPSTGDIDVKATTNSGNLFSSRLIVGVSIDAASTPSTGSQAFFFMF